jgi:hypothetical protein
MQRRPFLLSSAAPLLGWGLLGHAPSQAADERTTIAGIKEALAVGTEKAVKSLGREDGYYTHAVVKILLPSSVQSSPTWRARRAFPGRSTSSCSA